MSGDIGMLERQSMLATSFLPADLRQNIIQRVNEVDVKIKNSEQIITLNVGGLHHMVKLNNFVEFPSTRLGRLARATNNEEVLSLCDRWTEGDLPIYFFDRSFAGFNSILDLYRLGSLHLSDSLCALETKKELDYWMMDELWLEPCCALKFYPEIELCTKEIASNIKEDTKEKERKRIEEEGWGDHLVGKFVKKIWYTMEYPETSICAQVVAFVSLGIVVLSTLCFILSTFPEFQDPETEGSPLMIIFQTTHATESIYYNQTIPGKAGKIMRLVRVMRIMRIFKLVRHFAGLQSLLYTLKQAYKELGLLFLLIFVSVLTLSSLVYFAEKDIPGHSWTFLDSFWWGLMTITTVGYGHLSPASFVGKALGGFCALIGVFIQTLPVPIVVNSFASYYKNRLWRNEVAQKKRERAEGQRSEVMKILEVQQVHMPH